MDERATEGQPRRAHECGVHGILMVCVRGERFKNHAGKTRNQPYPRHGHKTRMFYLHGSMWKNRSLNTSVCLFVYLLIHTSHVLILAAFFLLSLSLDGCTSDPRSALPPLLTPSPLRYARLRINRRKHSAPFSSSTRAELCLPTRLVALGS